MADGTKARRGPLESILPHHRRNSRLPPPRQSGSALAGQTRGHDEQRRRIRRRPQFPARDRARQLSTQPDGACAGPDRRRRNRQLPPDHDRGGPAPTPLGGPAGGPPWEWQSFQVSVPVVVIALWLAAILGGGGVAAGLAAVRGGVRVSAGQLLIFGLLVVAILTVLPPVGSSDSLDYAGYGRMVVLGHSPY